jgi:hypothetical protein
MIHGQVAAGFEAVREEFEGCFTELGETGAAFTAASSCAEPTAARSAPSGARRWRHRGD